LGFNHLHALVIQILDRRARGVVTTVQVVNALTYLESYFVRRILIGRATANLNRTLLQAVRAVADEADIDVALRRFLSTGRKHFATDAQIRQAIQTVPFYWQGRGLQKKLILQWLEEALGSKEVVDPASLTIEHVLPQTLSDEVREQFAAGLAEGADVTYEHERVVHTLGNLTLTGYNSELSNHPFKDKRTKLATSGLLMNQEIAGQESWGAVEIAERGSLLAERVIALWPGPDETVVSDAASVETSALRATVAEVLGAIPAGRWTSYGEVAIVAGTYPQPLAAVLVRYELPNAWRVLQAAGTVSPGFRWTDPTRKDDPRDVLAAEGVRFDESGRALPEDFLTAQDLAAAAGLDIEDESAPWREGGSGGAGVGPDQEAFYTELRALGDVTAENIDSWRRPARQHWYDISIGSSRAHLSLTVNSVKKRVGVELYVPDDAALFQSLYAERDVIETEVGSQLDWQELPDKKASRIMAFNPGDFRDPSSRADLQRWMVETADTFAKVFRIRV
jgi:alkylated DNA nucleotide flippase Atl1